MRSKREIILVSLAGVALLYGLYAYVLAPRRTPATPAAPPAGATDASGDLPEVASQLAKAQEQLAQINLPPLVRFTVKRAVEAWDQRLFLPHPLPEELLERDALRRRGIEALEEARQAELQARQREEQEERRRREELRRRFDYSGFVANDGRLCAVINGVVCAPGEEIWGVPGYRLKQVTPEEVVIEDVRQAADLRVPLRDTAPSAAVVAPRSGE